MQSPVLGENEETKQVINTNTLFINYLSVNTFPKSPKKALSRSCQAMKSVHSLRGMVLEFPGPSTVGAK